MLSVRAHTVAFTVHLVIYCTLVQGEMCERVYQKNVFQTFNTINCKINLLKTLVKQNIIIIFIKKSTLSACSVPVRWITVIKVNKQISACSCCFYTLLSLKFNSKHLLGFENRQSSSCSWPKMFSVKTLKEEKMWVLWFHSWQGITVHQVLVHAFWDYIKEIRGSVLVTNL